MANVDLKSGDLVAVRRAFGPAFQKLAEEDERLVAVTADLGGSVNLNDFAKAHPDRYINCGVAEQDMIGIAAGLAMTGHIPYAITFGSFLGRAMDHVRQSIGHNRLKVNVVGSHGGISNGMDGTSAHAIEDVALFRAVPSFSIVSVADANQLVPALRASLTAAEPVYLRLYREPTPVLYSEDAPFTLGKANVLREGKDVTVVAAGPHVAFCQRWAESLVGKVDVELLDSHTIRPLDADAILASARKTGRVLTVEDHLTEGGLGSAVAEMLAEQLPTPMRRMGLTGYATSGPYYELLDHVGLGQSTFEELLTSLLNASVQEG